MQVGKGSVSSQAAHLRCDQNGVVLELMHACQLWLEEATWSNSVHLIRCLNTQIGS